jgi:hypothetical protein
MDNIKKPGRKKKVVEEPNKSDPPEKEPPVYKKRGRKPKGGKIIVTTAKDIIQEPQKQNIILHLKCSCNDINNIYNIDYIQSESNNNILPFNNNDSQELKIPDYKEKNISENKNNNNQIHNTSTQNTELWKKIKLLSASLHSNIIPNKKSNCFWCTCEFDGPPVFIPKHKTFDKYNVYGIYCSPECAAAFIFNENIDSSQKFERYYLLNNIYSSIYNYSSNIKPAPSPLYTLNKFMGNLTIQEYRSLSNNNQLITTIDKPMTRTFPEIFEDNDEYNIKNLPNNDTISTYKLCRKSNNKTKYITENFSI